MLEFHKHYLSNEEQYMIQCQLTKQSCGRNLTILVTYNLDNYHYYTYTLYGIVWLGI